MILVGNFNYPEITYILFQTFPYQIYTFIKLSRDTKNSMTQRDVTKLVTVLGIDKINEFLERKGSGRIHIKLENQYVLVNEGLFLN